MSNDISKGKHYKKYLIKQDYVGKPLVLFKPENFPPVNRSVGD